MFQRNRKLRRLLFRKKFLRLSSTISRKERDLSIEAEETEVDTEAEEVEAIEEATTKRETALIMVAIPMLQTIM
jgi:hypothetical protein